MAQNTAMHPPAVTVGTTWQLLVERDKNAHTQVLPPKMFSVGLGLTRY